VPPIPAPLDQLRHRRFSFYPAIVNVKHNEWVVCRADWNDVQVMNTKTSDELWIPLRYFREISLIEEPVVIVGLVKELEYKAGAVMPHVRRVIEMPLAANDSFRPRFLRPETESPAAVVAIREESGTSRRFRAAVAGCVLACVTAAIVLRDWKPSRLTASPGLHLPLRMSGDPGDLCRIGRAW